MTRSYATHPAGTRCSLTVEREAAGLYRLTCTCGDIRAIHSTRDGATRKATRHGEATGRGYSVTHR